MCLVDAGGNGTIYEQSVDLIGVAVQSVYPYLWKQGPFPIHPKRNGMKQIVGLKLPPTDMMLTCCRTGGLSRVRREFMHFNQPYQVKNIIALICESQIGERIHYCQRFVGFINPTRRSSWCLGCIVAL